MVLLLTLVVYANGNDIFRHWDDFLNLFK